MWPLAGPAKPATCVDTSSKCDAGVRFAAHAQTRVLDPNGLLTRADSRTETTLSAVANGRGELPRYLSLLANLQCITELVQLAWPDCHHGDEISIREP